MTYAQAKSRNDKRGMGEAHKRQKRETHLQLSAKVYGPRTKKHKAIKRLFA